MQKARDATWPIAAFVKIIMQWAFTLSLDSKVRNKEDIHEMKFMKTIDTLLGNVAGYCLETSFPLIALLSREKGRRAWHQL